MRPASPRGRGRTGGSARAAGARRAPPFLQQPWPQAHQKQIDELAFAAQRQLPGLLVAGRRLQRQLAETHLERAHPGPREGTQSRPGPLAAHVHHDLDEARIGDDEDDLVVRHGHGPEGDQVERRRHLHAVRDIQHVLVRLQQALHHRPGRGPLLAPAALVPGVQERGRAREQVLRAGRLRGLGERSVAERSQVLRLNPVIALTHVRHDPPPRSAKTVPVTAGVKRGVVVVTGRLESGRPGVHVSSS